MRVGIDGYNLAMARGTGIATYTVELVRALTELRFEVDGIFGIDVPSNRAMRQTAFFDQYRQPPPVRQRPGGLRKRLRIAGQVGRAFLPLPVREVPLDDLVVASADPIASLPPIDRLLSRARLFEGALTAFRRTGRFSTVTVSNPPQIMHWTYPLPLKVAGARNIYTLHDIVPLKLPYTTLDDKTFYDRLIRGCLRHATQICTVSESSKRDIIDRFRVDERFITNTYQVSSLSEALQSSLAENTRMIESLFGLDRRGYFLFYGAIEPKKNVGRLIEAYLALRSSTPLVLVGGRAWQSGDELSLVPRNGASGQPGTYAGPCGQKIIRLDYLSRPLLAKLIQGAKALVFPSLYEGFGLPVLEAMQVGTPVITSNLSSLPEVAGNAGLLVDPYDVGSLIAAMTRIDDDANLARAMSVRGRRRAEHFSQDRYLERLTALYQAAMAR